METYIVLYHCTNNTRLNRTMQYGNEDVVLPATTPEEV